VRTPQYFIAVIDDITDRKQMEQELKDGRQRLEAAIAASGGNVSMGPSNQ
jgi:hypothetical protein